MAGETLQKYIMNNKIYYLKTVNEEFYGLLIYYLSRVTGLDVL